MTSTIINAPNDEADGNPDVTGLSEGRAAIAYQSRGPEGAFEVVLRLREADGTLGPEIRPQGEWTLPSNPELTTLKDGSFLLSWLAVTGADGTSFSNVLAQRYDALGGALSPVFEIARQPLDEGRYTLNVIEADPDGGFLANIRSVSETGRRSDSWSAFAADDSTTPSESGSSLAGPLAGDGFVRIATELGGDTDYSLVYTEYDDEWGGAETLSYNLVPTSLLGLGQGRFVPLGDDRTLLVVNGMDGSFDPSYRGETTIDYFLAPTHAYVISSTPDVQYGSFAISDPIFIAERQTKVWPDDFSATALADGGFVVTWTEDWDVFAQLVDANGVQQGGNFLVSGGEQRQSNLVAAKVEGGDILFVWQENDGGDLDVQSRQLPIDELSTGTFSFDAPEGLSLSGRVTSSSHIAGGDEVFPGATLRVEGRASTAGDIVGVDVQWGRYDSSIAGGFEDKFEPIEGATGRTFALTETDLEDEISVQVTIRLDGGEAYTFSGVNTDYDLFPYAYRVVEPRATFGNDFLLGGENRELIDAEAGDDTVQGGEGNDTIGGNSGDDVLEGQGGDDFLDGDRGSDTILGGAGDDFLRGDEDEDQLRGGDGDDFLAGGSKNDMLFGDRGDDTLAGGAGLDTMVGGQGSDLYYVNAPGDVVVERGRWEGRDTVIADTDISIEGSHIEELRLRSSYSPENAGHSGTGNALDNTLFGSGWNDTLNGGRGADTLSGGAGADEYVFTSPGGRGQVDRVIGFDAIEGDRIVIDADLVGLSAGLLPGSAFATGVRAQGPDDRVVFEAETGRVYVDLDGVGGRGQTLLALLEPGTDLSAENIFLI